MINFTIQPMQAIGANLVTLLRIEIVGTQTEFRIAELKDAIKKMKRKKKKFVTQMYF